MNSFKQLDQGRRQWLQRSLMLMASSTLASPLLGCGFRLRGQASYQYAFKSIVSTFELNSAMGEEFKQQAQAQGLTVLSREADATQAQVLLRVHQAQRERSVVGIGISGQVTAIQLKLLVNFSLLTIQDKVLLNEIKLSQQREQTYTESAAIAKEVEEQTLYNDMQQDMVRQILRRLAAVRSL